MYFLIEQSDKIQIYKIKDLENQEKRRIKLEKEYEFADLKEAFDHQNLQKTEILTRISADFKDEHIYTQYKEIQHFLKKNGIKAKEMV